MKITRNIDFFKKTFKLKDCSLYHYLQFDTIIIIIAWRWDRLGLSLVKQLLCEN